MLLLVTAGLFFITSVHLYRIQVSRYKRTQPYIYIVFPLLLELKLVLSVLMCLVVVYWFCLFIFICYGSLWSSWTVIVIQLCKLLHLFGIPSLQISAYALLVLSTTLPFIIHININSDAEDEQDLG